MSSTRDYIAQHYLSTGNAAKGQTTLTADGKRVRKVKKRRVPTEANNNNNSSSSSQAARGTGTIVDEDDIAVCHWEEDTANTRLNMLASRANAATEDSLMVDALGLADQDYDEGGCRTSSARPSI